MSAFRTKKRSIPWFLLATVFVVLYFSSVLISQQVYLNQVGRDQTAADARLLAARERNAELKAERERLSDASHIERIAREELGMTKDGELPYSSFRHSDK